MKKYFSFLCLLGFVLSPTFVSANTYSALFTKTSNNYLTANTNLGIDGGNITIGGWFYLNSNPSNNWAMFQQQSGSSHTAYYARYFNDGSGNYFIRFVRDFCNVGGTTSFDTANLNWTVGTWHQVYETYDGSILKGYVDGSSVGSVSTSGNGSTCVNGFTIGGADTASTGTYTVNNLSWDGLIDDFRVYTSALSSGSIATLHSSPADVTGAESTLVDGYNFNSTLVADVGSGAHTLTNTNSVTQSTTLPFGGGGGGGGGSPLWNLSTTTATSTDALIGSADFGLAVIITLLSFLLIGFVWNNIYKKK